MMDQVIGSLIASGPMGAVLAVMCYFIYQQHKRIGEITDRLFDVVENNTKAITKLDESVEKLIRGAEPAPKGL
jgi:hypothetical protein